MKLPLRLALAAFLIKFVPLAEGSIAVLHHYRYGEDDAVSAGALGASKDRAGANDLILGGAGPLYSTNVGAEAVARTGSSRSGDYSAQCFSYAALASTATDNFGIETWVKVNASTENRYIVYNGNGGGDGWGLQQTGATFSARFGGVGNFGSAAVQADVWTHLALVRDNGTATFYVNGVASGSSASVPKLPTNVFTVGGPPPPYQTEFLRGMVDETRVFSFAPGSFSPADLLCRATEVQVEQPAGSVVANGGTVDFGAVAVGNEATRTFSIRNAGGNPVQLDSPAVSLSGKHAADYTILSLPSFAEPAMPNAGFEDPGFLPGAWTYGILATGWSMGSSAGTANHGSPWFVNAPPEGSQAAFIQRDSADAYISRSVNFPSAGEYLIHFSAVRRSAEYPANDIAVKVDGTTVGTVPNASQPDDTWRTFTVAYQCPGAGDRSLSFVGLRGGGLDCASAIDEIRITYTAAEFQVKLAPGAAGIREGILTIPNNDPFDNPYRVNLRGGIAQAPAATTLGALHAKLASEQRIKGTVYPDGNPTTIAIEYGTTTGYGSSFTVTTSANGFETIPVNTVLTGLTPGTLYHYRVVASNSAGSTGGENRTFTTRNDNLNVTALYRMGENDGAEEGEIAADTVMHTVYDSVGGYHLKEPQVNDPAITATPLFSSAVGANPAAEAGSTRALDFRDGRSYASRPLFFTPAGNYLMEAWVKPAATLPHTVGWILYNGDNNTGYGFIQFGDHFSCQWHGGFVEEFGWAPAVQGQWIHLAIVVQNDKATFYVNGVANGNTIRPASSVPAAGGLSMGKAYHYDFRSSGALDEVRLATFPAGQFDPTSLLIKSIPPEVSAPTATAIAATSAVLGGTVTTRSGNPVTERGVVFSKTLENGNPLVDGAGVSKQVASGDYGAFGVAVSGLSPVTQYSYRPYAVSTAGTIYGPVASFTTPVAVFTPLAWYRFGEADPGAVAGGSSAGTRDSIGMRHLVLGGTPLYTAATTADPATNSTLALDFGNAAVQATGATLQPQLTENFGFEAWAKSTTTTGRHWLLYNGNLGGDGWGLFQDGASYFVYCADRVQFGGGSVTPDQWTHLAVVRVNGLTTLYVNGDAVASSTIAPNLPGGSFAAGAHQGNPGGGERWVGAIDEIRYFTFPPGQFVPRDLLLRKAEIQITQAEGPEIFDGGTRDFGALPVGSSATAGFTIHSTGNLDLTGFQASLEGPDAAEFALTAPETLAMAPGASRSFTVRFDAASGGTKSAVLRLTTNDPDENPFDIHLSAVATDPEIEVQQPVSVPVPDGGSRQFEKLLLGNQQTLSFAIRNTGNVPLNLTGTPRVAITGPHAADFTVAAQPLPTAFPGGGGQTHFQSGFETPALTHLGNFTYNIAGSGWAIEGKAGVARNISPWFVNNAPEGSQAAFIQADGSTAGTISRSVNFPEAGLYTVRFQAVRRGATNPAVDIVVAVGGAAIGTVANGSQPDNSWRTFEIPYLCTAAGDHELRFTASRSGGDYASAIDAVEVVSSPVFDVTFAPSAHGPRTATLVIASNDRDEGSYEIELSGRGQGVVAELAIDQPTGSPALSGGSRDFGSVDVGSFSSLDFTLRNTGLVDLLLSGTPPVVIDGPDAGDFSVTVQPPAILPVSTALAEGFESPALGGGGFSYAPGGSAWTYGSSTGRARNGSPWFVMPAPEGEHAAFIQRQPGGSAAAATISRSYNFPAAGDYLVSFSLTRRSDLFPAVDLAVKMDGSTLGSVAHGSQADDDWHRFSVAYHCSNPGDHVLTFTGSRAEAGDYASAIDRIQIEMATVFTVKFAPAAGGPRSAALSIPSNDPFSPYTLQLTGSGVQVYTALESWRLLHFATAANAGNAADDADPNHNGIPNLIEYALGGDPAGNATGIAILPQMELDAEGHAKIRFTRYPGRVGITLAAQGSSDLSGAWADLAVSVDGAAFGNLAAGVLIDESGTGESRETTLTDGGHAGGMRFLRLKVTSP